MTNEKATGCATHSKISESTDSLPQRVYRYRALGTSWPYLLNELRGHVWCSAAQYLNDPFDGVVYTEPEQRKIVARTDGQTTKISTQYVWCVACFSETWDNPTMWANYADKFSGVCLGYDTQGLKELTSITVKNYQKNMSEGQVTAVRGAAFSPVEYPPKFPGSFKSEKDAIFTKNETWWYEQEWRFAIKYIFSGNGTGRICNMEGQLKEIIVPSHIRGANWQAIKAVRDAFCPGVTITRITPVPSERCYRRSDPM